MCNLVAYLDLQQTFMYNVVFYIFFQDRHELGELLLSLNYLPSAGRLNIDVIKAKQLLQTDIVGGSGRFILAFPKARASLANC